MRTPIGGPRLYLFATYLASIGVAGWQVAHMSSEALPLAVLWSAAVFVLMAYLGERAAIQVNGSVKQSLAMAVHVAAILLFPRPLPLVIALVAALVWQLVQARLPWSQRAFAICRSTLTVGLTAALLALVTTPWQVLRAGHIVTALPALVLLVGVYYLVDTLLVLGWMATRRRQPLWRLWWRHLRRLLVPELATGAMGILGAAACRYDPVLLILLAAPALVMRMAFRTLQAEDDAVSLRQRSTHLEAVLAAGHRMQLQQAPADMLLSIAEAARTIAEAEGVTAYLRTDEDPPMLERVAIVPSGVRAAGPARLLASSVGAGIREEDDDRGRSVLVPLQHEGAGIVGLLTIGGVAERLSADQRDILGILATQVAIALQNVRLHEQALAQASEDSLTGLLNHRSFQTRLREEVSRARADGGSLALLMVDLDNFGTINNTYGHQAGDAALKAVAGVLRASVRASDVVARYGGDEFAVILPATAMEVALPIAERIHAGIASLTLIEHGVRVPLDTSIGAAALPAHATTREQLIRAADQAAYAAKHGGKGRVCRPEDATLVLDHDPTALAAQLQHANLATVEALAAAVDAKDPYTHGHAQRVAAYAAAIARAMDLPAADVARVRLAGLLHDVGKIGVPDAILTKPGQLEDAEFAVLRQHPVVGARMLSAVPFLQEVLPAVRHHHERWDGAGYPDGIAAEAIPQDATILALADALDAMTSSRTYRPALPVHEARRRVWEASGTQFNPAVVAAFELAMTQGELKLLSAGGTAVLPTRRLARAS